MREVGAEIRRLRQARGWTGAQLAVYAGMAPSAISQIETGRRSPNAGSLEKIATALEVAVVDLFPKAQSPLPLDSPDNPAMSEQDIEALYSWAGLIDEFSKGFQEDLKHIESGNELFYLLMRATLTYMGGLKMGQDEFAMHIVDNDTQRTREAKKALRDSLQLLHESALAIASSSRSVDEFERQQQAMITQLADYRMKRAG
jgi:transcriptional regulator with XRE-family HTH domain